MNASVMIVWHVFRWDDIMIFSETLLNGKSEKREKGKDEKNLL